MTSADNRAARMRTFATPVGSRYPCATQQVTVPSFVSCDARHALPLFGQHGAPPAEIPTKMAPSLMRRRLPCGLARPPDRAVDRSHHGDDYAKFRMIHCHVLVLSKK
jgi:hypothetical protein